MLRNYFIIAWRNIWRRAFASVINIFGLSIPIALSFIIGVYVWQEYNVNAQLLNADRQYILQSKWKVPGTGIESTTVVELPRALDELYPNLVSIYYRCDGITVVASKDGRHFRELVSIGDSAFF